MQRTIDALGHLDSNDFTEPPTADELQEQLESHVTDRAEARGEEEIQAAREAGIIDTDGKPLQAIPSSR